MEIFTMRKTNFTLIELLIVIAIIAILAGMLLPALGQVRKTAEKAVCASNQKQILMMHVSYGSTYNDFIMPSRITLNLYRKENGEKVRSAIGGMQSLLVHAGVIKDGAWDSHDTILKPEIITCPSAKYGRFYDRYGKILHYFQLQTYSVSDQGASYTMSGYEYGGDGLQLKNENVSTGQYPRYMGKVRRPSMKAYLTESGQDGGRLPGSHNFQKLDLVWIAEKDLPAMQDDSLNGRHNKTCNIGWLDGHVSNVSSEKQAFNYWKIHNLAFRGDDLKKQSWLGYYYY